ncbi:hypothetical protein AZH51_08505 [Branchiibius sp. NY16-3462-2]|nr:hypothetical protein AZH51_08505 [Branchiibius sp. NY16-3462-2]
MSWRVQAVPLTVGWLPVDVVDGFVAAVVVLGRAELCGWAVLVVEHAARPVINETAMAAFPAIRNMPVTVRAFDATSPSPTQRLWKT